MAAADINSEVDDRAEAQKKCSSKEEAEALKVYKTAKAAVEILSPEEKAEAERAAKAAKAAKAEVEIELDCDVLAMALTSWGVRRTSSSMVSIAFDTSGPHPHHYTLHVVI